MTYRRISTAILWLRAVALVLFILLAIAILSHLIVGKDRRIIESVPPSPCPALGIPTERINDPVPIPPRPGELDYTNNLVQKQENK